MGHIESQDDKQHILKGKQPDTILVARAII